MRGDTTVRMLDRLAPDTELHVIDPVPEFDPQDHMSRFPGRYVFHRDISHNVLPELAPVDVALVDGDHNWYTVYHELKMLADTARSAGRPLPVLIMHDVLWPYGRRDLYYTPENIPEQYRHAYAQRGMRPGRSELLPEGGGGVSPTLNNALVEGGPRNGVMTALEDFMAESDENLRLVVLPIYFGLAIVVSEERPALTRAARSAPIPMRPAGGERKVEGRCSSCPNSFALMPSSHSTTSSMDFSPNSTAVPSATWISSRGRC